VGLQTAVEQMGAADIYRRQRPLQAF